MNQTEGHPSATGERAPDNQNVVPTTKKQWYDNIGIVILLLCCCFPVGLVALFMNRKASKKTKLIIAGVWLLLIIIALPNFREANREEKQRAPERKATETSQAAGTGITTADLTKDGLIQKVMSTGDKQHIVLEFKIKATKCFDSCCVPPEYRDQLQTQNSLCHIRVGTAGIDIVKQIWAAAKANPAADDITVKIHIVYPVGLGEADRYGKREKMAPSPKDLCHSYDKSQLEEIRRYENSAAILNGKYLHYAYGDLKELLFHYYVE